MALERQRLLAHEAPSAAVDRKQAPTQPLRRKIASSSLLQLFIDAANNLNEFLHKHAQLRMTDITEVNAMQALLPVDLANLDKLADNFAAQQNVIKQSLDANPISCCMSLLNAITCCTAYSLNILCRQVYTEYLKILDHHLNKIKAHPDYKNINHPKWLAAKYPAPKKPAIDAKEQLQQHKARPYLQQRGLPTIKENISNPRATYPVRMKNKFMPYSNMMPGAYYSMILAMVNAKKIIFLSGWMFEPQIAYPGLGEKTLGQFLIEKAKENPKIEIAILLWRQIHKSQKHDEAFNYLKSFGELPANLQLRYARRTGTGWSHHQKFLITDDLSNEVIAFYGSADMRGLNMESADHPILDTKESGNVISNIFKANGAFSTYESTEDKLDKPIPRTPWHEVVSLVKGQIAYDILKEFFERWIVNDAGAASDSIGSQDEDHRVLERYYDLIQQRPALVAEKEEGANWNAQVVRSAEQCMYEGAWHLKKPYEKSIHKAYLQAIYNAEKFIYIENQFLIGGPGLYTGAQHSTNRIPQALVDKIAAQHKAKKPFHVFIMLPMLPGGQPGSTTTEPLRYLQWQTLTWMMREIEKQTGEFWGNYLSCFFPAKWHGLDAKYDDVAADQNTSRAKLIAYSQRTYIYVHSKIMIVDDNCMINGSANLNERSVGGCYDSELGVYQWASAEDEKACVAELREFRQELWATYMGTECMTALGDAGFVSPELPENVVIIRNQGSKNLQRYLKDKAPDGATAATGYMLTWPFKMEKGHVGEYINDQVTFLPATTLSNQRDRFFVWQPPLEDGPTKMLKAASCCNVRAFN